MPENTPRRGAAVRRSQPAAHAATGPYNILLMLLDDVGQTLLAAYDDKNAFAEPFPYAKTPNLDRLVQFGVRFTQARVSPRCSPTRAQVQTGRYAFRTGVGDLIVQSPVPGYALPRSERILPELLAPGGYRCGCVGKWHIGNSTVSANPSDPQSWRTTPNDAGYAHFAGCLFNLNNQPAPIERPDYYTWLRVVNGNAAIATRYATSVQADDAIDFILGGPEPWFLYLPWSAIHGPFNWPPKELHSFGPKPPDNEGKGGQPFAVNTRARAMLEALDKEIGRVLGALPRDVAARTMILVLGDNGAERSMLEIESTDITSPSDPTPPSTAPYDPARAKNTLYESGIKVPLFVSGPLVGAPGSTVEHLVDGVDLFTTVLSIAQRGGAAPTLPPFPVDGVDLLPLIEDPASGPVRSFSFSEIFEPGGLPATGAAASKKREIRRAYIDAQGFKLIVRRGGSFGTPGHPPRDEVFNVFEDPFELHALPPSEFKHLYGALDALLGQGPPLPPQ